MISVAPTEDYGLIKSIMTHPRIWRFIGDDQAPPPEQFEVPRSSSILYLLAKDDDETLGVFLFAAQNSVCMESHHCLLPQSWGARARDAAKKAITWLFTNTRCVRIVGSTPTCNRAALKFAQDLGFTPFGLNRKSFMRYGVLHDQILFGMSKPEVS